MDRTAYLSRPLIEGVVYQIGSDKISVQDNITRYIGIENCQRISLQQVQQHFRELRQAAKISGKIRLKGVSKFLPAVNELYMPYCTACNQIERLYAELTELVHQIQKEGIHRGSSNDELLDAAGRKESEISMYYRRDSDYSRFLDYDLRVCEALRDKEWESEDSIELIIPIA